MVNGASKNAIAQRLSAELQLNDLSTVIDQFNKSTADIAMFSTEVQAVC